MPLRRVWEASGWTISKTMFAAPSPTNLKVKSLPRRLDRFGIVEGDILVGG